MLPQRRPAPRARRPVRDRALGARAAHGSRPASGATVGSAEPGYIGWSTPTTCCTSTSSRTTSASTRPGEARLFRSPHRYIWPAELDLMAQLAGFELETRHADWAGAEFTADSARTSPSTAFAKLPA